MPSSFSFASRAFRLALMPQLKSNWIPAPFSRDHERIRLYPLIVARTSSAGRVICRSISSGVDPG